MNHEHHEQPAAVVDTSILMELPHVDTLDWGVNSITIYVLDSVVHELEGLARADDDALVASAAKRALAVLEDWFTPPLPDDVQPAGRPARIVRAKTPSDVAYPLDPESVDHQQIALARDHIVEGGFCAVVTRDKEMADIATSASPSVPTVIVSRGRGMGKAIRERFARKMDWFERFRREQAGRAESEPVKPAQDQSDARRGRRERRLEEVARHFYGRIRSMHHKAVLSIAPLEARIALTAHMVPILTQQKNRVVFLFVEDDAKAAYWAGQLRERCDLPAGAVRVFGEEGVSRVHGTRVVIYRHAQIERRYGQHAARFKDLGRRITTVVENCDLLEPAWIAMLLFECDQFIGFAPYPIDHPQATAGRMLTSLLQQRIGVTYTFADAERDGWLRPFDLRRHPIHLTDDEHELYEATNEHFLALHSRIRRRYPELSRAPDLWRCLRRLLVRVVDHEAAQLFVLQEQREQLAQMAAGKRESLFDLVRSAGRPARCLILDFETLWTRLLTAALTDAGMAVEVFGKAADDVNMAGLWRDFEKGDLDCLILHRTPPQDYVGARIDRVISMTPLTPLSALAAAIDWSLCHAVGGPIMSVDLLYTTNTPEQQAMADIADGCFGLRFRS